MNRNFIRRLLWKDATSVAGLGDKFPFCLPAVRHLEQLVFESPVTFFVGENGTGKSTLIEAIAAGFGFNPEGGTRNFAFSTASTHSDLYRHILLEKGADYPTDGFFLRAESFYNASSYIDELDKQPLSAPPLASFYGGISLHDRSHGEAFMALVQNRFSGHGLYILDEPEAALSPTRQMALLCEIHALVKKRSQFIIATHSPILMAYPDSTIYAFDDAAVKKTAYSQTEHFIVTRRFLNDPVGMLKHLLGDEPLSN